MTTITQYGSYARVSLAAYATSLVAGPSSNVDRYQQAEAGMSANQAEAFDAEWSVVQQSTPDASGFSAVLLRNRTTNEKVLAIAGTNDWQDWIADAVVAQYGTALAMPQYASLVSFHAQLVSTGKLGAFEQVVVTGHSLGGFLAQAFTARHPGAVSAAYTYNAPGFGTIESLLGFFGVTDLSAASKITNVYAADGPSGTAGLHQTLGATQGIRIEADAANPLNNHSIVRLSDALAVYDAHSSLQPGIGTDQIGALFMASGHGQRRLEDALDALRTVFISPASNDQSRTPTGDREAFHLNLSLLRNDPGFQALSGQVDLASASTSFASRAQADSQAALAYRYALLELLPFAVVAHTEAQNQTLYGANPQRLSLYDEATGQGELTRQWLADRAQMLELVSYRALADVSGDVVRQPGRTQEIRFTDMARDIGFTAAGVGGGLDAQRMRISFGGDGNDTISGADRADRLYGGAGADTLDGGSGNDLLQGGAGLDSYNFAPGAGHDTILDSHGDGVITVAGLGEINGTGARRMPGDVWQSTDRSVSYALIDMGDNRKDLHISFASRDDVITIQNWSAARNLGITLEQAITTPPPPPTEQSITLIDPPGSGGDSADLTWNGLSLAINGTVDDDEVYSGRGDDQIVGNGGGDLIYGNDGDDRLYGGAVVESSLPSQLRRPPQIP